MAASPLCRELRKKLRLLHFRLAYPEKVTRRQEALHDLRVELKEWRAALQLLHGVDPDFPHAEIQERFKPLFAAAGDLRFWQLQRGFVNRSKPTAPAFSQQYRAHVRRRLGQARKDFLAAAAATGCPGWGELKHDVNRACDACSPEAMQSYFGALQADMTSLKTLLNRRRMSQLHELRKSLREYSDNRKLVTARLGFDPGPPAGLPVQSGWMHDLLGEWHDLEAACRQLAQDLRAADWADVGGLREGKAVLSRWKKAERAMWDAIMAVLPAAEASGQARR